MAQPESNVGRTNNPSPETVTGDVQASVAPFEHGDFNQGVNLINQIYKNHKSDPAFARQYTAELNNALQEKHLLPSLTLHLFGNDAALKKLDMNGDGHFDPNNDAVKLLSSRQLRSNLTPVEQNMVAYMHANAQAISHGKDQITKEDLQQYAGEAQTRDFKLKFAKQVLDDPSGSYEVARKSNMFKQGMSQEQLVEWAHHCVQKHRELTPNQLPILIDAPVRGTIEGGKQGYMTDLVAEYGTKHFRDMSLSNDDRITNRDINRYRELNKDCLSPFENKLLDQMQARYQEIESASGNHGRDGISRDDLNSYRDQQANRRESEKQELARFGGNPPSEVELALKTSATVDTRYFNDLSHGKGAITDADLQSSIMLAQHDLNNKNLNEEGKARAKDDLEVASFLQRQLAKAHQSSATFQQVRTWADKACSDYVNEDGNYTSPERMSMIAKLREKAENQSRDSWTLPSISENDFLEHMREEHNRQLIEVAVRQLIEEQRKQQEDQRDKERNVVPIKSDEHHAQQEVPRQHDTTRTCIPQEIRPIEDCQPLPPIDRRSCVPQRADAPSPAPISHWQRDRQQELDEQPSRGPIIMDRHFWHHLHHSRDTISMCDGRITSTRKLHHGGWVQDSQGPRPEDNYHCVTSGDGTQIIQYANGKKDLFVLR